MRVFFLWYYYPWYLRSYYRGHAAAASLPFAEHRRRLLDDHFWWPADLAAHMAGRGYETEFVVGNAEALQKKWASENGVRFTEENWEREIIVEQVKRFAPDAVWVASHFEYFGPFLRQIRKHTGRVILWVGEPWPAPPDVDGISVLITENPGTFKSVQHKFDRVLVTKPAFDPGILRALGPVEKRYDATVVGQFTKVHRRRAALAAHLLRHGVDLRLFGLVAEDTVDSALGGVRLAAWHLLRRGRPREAASALKRALRPTPDQRNLDLIARRISPPVYGMDMHRVLAASRVTLNVHGDIAGSYAGNMRMFEATGVGACLLTEHSDNLESLFAPGREVLTYRTAEDLLETLRRVKAGDIDADGIARAGQRRTLREHTMERLLNDIAPAFRL